jgi:hypothetical protein
MSGLSHLSDALAAPRLRRALTRPRLWARVTVTHALAPVAALGVLVLFVQGHDLVWLAGLVAGAATTAWLLMARVSAAPATIDHGAADTRQQLELIEAHGWEAAHDVEGNLDIYEHVAVGPGGVILLHSRCAAHPQMATPNPRADAGAGHELMLLRRDALRSAANLRDEIEDATGETTWVQAVVVVWSDFPAGCIQDGRCVFISGPRLADWLRRRPGQLADVRAHEIRAALSELGIRVAA